MLHELASSFTRPSFKKIANHENVFIQIVKNRNKIKIQQKIPCYSTKYRKITYNFRVKLLSKMDKATNV